MMNLPPMIRYADTLHYDHLRGVVTVLDWRVPGARCEYTTPEALATALAARPAADSMAYLVGYLLALAARLRADRPADARRAAIIQAGEWLRQARPHDHLLATTIEEGLACADAAIMAGDDAEAALLVYAGTTRGRADRVAERCGRLAAGLLDEGDHLVTCGYAGPALGWLLASARDLQKPLHLTVLAPPPLAEAAQVAVMVARALGFPANTATPAEPFAGGGAQIYLLGATRIARDGSVAAPPTTAGFAAQARRSGMPCYVLGYDTVDPAWPGGAHDDVMPPEQISAIVTHRGIYRPAMIARHLGDGDAPLEVIPLRGPGV